MIDINMTDNNIPSTSNTSTSSPLFPSGDAQVSSEGLISESSKAIAQLKAENDRREKLLREEQELENRRILGGNSRAGTAKVQTDPEEEKKQRARQFWKGSAIEGYFK